MSLVPGTRFGPYEIVAAIGAGGMGEVYKARDTRLDRTVAIKILPDFLAADSQVRERFNREARAISQLDDPNICALFDVGELAGVPFLVMQFLEGETLEARLRNGALPLDQALAIAIQVSGALNTAHRAGIIHRDLKPGNVMLAKGGAKLLDFGLAKRSPAWLGPSSSMHPTTPAESITAEGTFLGTLPYMAPEQLEGEGADARTDIFAFGALLYEMLLGTKAFEGKSQAGLIRAIMSAEPDFDPLRRFGPGIDRLIRKCLAREPDRRWQSASDLHDELVWLASAPSSVDAPGMPVPINSNDRNARRATVATIAATVSTLVALGAVVLGRLGYLERVPTDRATFVASIVPPAGIRIRAGANHFALSPDGESLAFAGVDVSHPSGDALLWVRSLKTGTDQRLLDTDGADSPFWSPDSRYVGFNAHGKLKSVEIASGHVLTIADSTFNAPGAWNTEDTIVFAARGGDGLYRVSAHGGTATRLTTVDTSTGDQGQSEPTFLPDGRHFVYHTGQIQRVRAILVGSLDAPDRPISLPVTASGVTFASGYLLFLRRGTLFAQAFNSQRFELQGAPIVIAEHVATGGSVGVSAAFSVSKTGVLAYQTDTPAATDSELTWFDRTGKLLQRVGEPAEYGDLALSPDGQQIVVTLPAGAATSAKNLWIVNVDRGVRSRFTFDEPGEAAAVWSPKGDRLIFSSRVNGKGNLDVFQRASRSAAGDDLLLSGDPSVTPTSWSPDGRFLLYEMGFPNVASIDLWALPLDRDHKPFPLLTTPFNETQARFSPDGHWIAYVSDETGRREIYVMPFVDPGGTLHNGAVVTSAGKWQVSTTGGTTPRWRGDGRELFFVAPNNVLMSAAVESATAQFRVGTVQPLFTLHPAARGNFYDVSTDGRRILVNTDIASEHATSVPITLVTNWIATLKK